MVGDAEGMKVGAVVGFLVGSEVGLRVGDLPPKPFNSYDLLLIWMGKLDNALCENGGKFRKFGNGRQSDRQVIEEKRFYLIQAKP